MEINWDLLNFLLRLAQILFVPLAMWLIKEIWSLRKDVIELRSRVKVNEEKLDCAPDSKALHNLALAIEGLRGDVRATNEKLGGVERVVDKLDRVLERQESYLLNGGSK
jgi:predicted  nucleic acid-binding Zn-ribbon protein